MDAGRHLSLLEFIQIALEFAAEDFSAFLYSVYLPALLGQLKWKLPLLFRAKRL